MELIDPKADALVVGAADWPIESPFAIQAHENSKLFAEPILVNTLDLQVGDANLTFSSLLARHREAPGLAPRCETPCPAF